MPLLFLGFALLDNVVVYSALTKRSTPWSIVLGSAVGPLTLWAGYAAVSVPVSAPALLIGATTAAAWVPVHMWAIATLYRDDYAATGLPMAPVVWDPATLAVASGTSGLVMGAAAGAGLAFTRGTGAVWVAALVGVASLAIVGVAALLPWHPALAPRLVRLVTAYLVVVLMAAIGLAA